MTHPSRHRRRSKLRSWYVWHRWLGLSAALLVVVLASTGIALNHTEALRLDERPVRVEALLAWYGIEAGPMISFAVGERRLTQAGDHWYLDAEPFPGEFPQLRGAVAPPGLIAAAASDAVWLLTADGEVVERMDASAGVPGGIRRLGVDAGQRLVIEAAAGLYRSDENYAQWQPTTDLSAVTWARPSRPPAALRQEILARHRGEGLSLERVLLDLHSGRLFGAWGVYVMDAAAVLMLVLVGSGTWLWLRSRLRRQRR